MILLLASSSPRRRELLAHLDLEFIVTSADIDETVLAGEMPTAYISRMVQEKAKAVCSNFDFLTLNSHQQSPYVLILTADTIGVLPNGRDVLVKPTDKADAFAMWQAMSGREHQVWTAVQATLLKIDLPKVGLSKVAQGDNHQITADGACGKVIWQQQILETTKVEFIELTNADMERYWQTGEPLDKAGGYAIQGKAAAWVSRIEGSYSNVVGLPLAQTKALIEQAYEYYE